MMIEKTETVSKTGAVLNAWSVGIWDMWDDTCDWRWLTYPSQEAAIAAVKAMVVTEVTIYTKYAKTVEEALRGYGIVGRTFDVKGFDAGKWATEVIKSMWKEPAAT